jgi:hypothetical protein
MEELTMKRNVLTFVVLSLCLVMLTIFASCNGGGGSSSTTPTTLHDVTGSWYVGTSGGSTNLVLNLTQDTQGNITGTMNRGTSIGTDTGTIISGSNVNNTINIHVLFGTQHYIYEGKVKDADNMSGTLTSYYEPKDQNRVYEETFTATRAD